MFAGLTKETFLVVVEEIEHLWNLGREQIPRSIYLKSFPQQRQSENSTWSVSFEEWQTETKHYLQLVCMS